MTDDRAQPPPSGPPDISGGGLRLGTLFGIEIRLDSSLTIIFALLIFILGGSVFPQWHPDWPASTTWTTAAAAGVLFFASVLAHELAHSLVSRRFGIGVRRITLFLFGGVAEIQEEPREPRAEFLIAIVGPLTSLVIGLLCTYSATLLAGADLAELFPADGESAVGGLSPLATLLLWLGPINIVLGVFNMMPGFPLDGGRVLRALLWWLTGDLRRATQIASQTGRMFGWFLMILGVMQAVSGIVMQGLWLVLIGWFLSNAASSSYRQMVVRDLFKGVTARDMMRSRFETVTAQLRLGDFIDKHLLQSPQLLWPVLEDGQLIGLVTLQEVKSIAAADRDTMTVGQVMRTDLGAQSLPPDTDANQTLLALSTHSAPLAVVENNRVIGLLSQFDSIKWVQLHLER
jgi:Zn-dependent protease/predicted transcriptional regulator